MSQRLRFLAPVVLSSAVAALAGCGESPSAAPTAPPVVTVSYPVEREVTDYEDFTGRTDAVQSVEVRARVNGYLTRIFFRPGQEVRGQEDLPIIAGVWGLLTAPGVSKPLLLVTSLFPGRGEGDLLFEIDPRPYQAELNRAEGEVTRYRATVHRLDIDYERVRRLVGTGAISREEYDNVAGRREEAIGQLTAALANLERYKLDLGFTQVRAPISGRVGRDLVTVGNLVTADKTLLTTIVSIDPVYAYFDVDERTMLHIQELIRQGKFKSAREEGSRVPVYLGLANEEGNPHEGVIDFVDPRVDPGTGTLRVRAVFRNPVVMGSRVLSPGLFARIRMPVGGSHKTLLITERALVTDQGQKFLYVVNEQNEVVQRAIKLGALHDGLREIVEGLSPSDRVIVNGLQRVRPGVTVDPRPGEMNGAPIARAGSK